MFSKQYYNMKYFITLLSCLLSFTIERKSINIQNEHISKKEYSNLKKPGIDNVIIGFYQKKNNYKLLSTFQADLFVKTKNTHNLSNLNYKDFGGSDSIHRTELLDFKNKEFRKLTNNEIKEDKNESVYKSSNETNSITYSEERPSSSFSSSFSPSLSQTETNIEEHSSGKYRLLKIHLLAYIFIFLIV